MEAAHAELSSPANVQAISREEQQELVAALCQYLVTLVLAPISFEIESSNFSEEVADEPFDLRNGFLTQLYQAIVHECDFLTG